MFILSNKIKGVTLTEVVFSSAIIALVMVSVIVIFVQVIGISKRVTCDYTATNLAKSRLERARRIIDTRGFDFLTDLTESDRVLNADGTPDEDGEFIRTTTITHPYNGKERLAHIFVSVYYTFKGKKSNTPVVMTTIFADIDY